MTKTQSCGLFVYQILYVLSLFSLFSELRINVLFQVKSKVMESFLVDSLPKKASKTAKISSYTRKNKTYELYNLGKDNEDETTIGGEELRTMTCLLPRKSKKGKLFMGLYHLHVRTTLC